MRTHQQQGQTRRHWSGICPTIRPLLTYSGLILCPPNPIWGGFLLTPFFAFCLLRTYCNFGGQGGWLHFCNFLQNQKLRGCQDLCVMRYGGITHKGESGFMRFGAIWCVLVRLGAISCDLISKKKRANWTPFCFSFLKHSMPKRGLDAQLYSLLARYVCDLHALHDLWPRCDARCDAEVRRQGATPTLLSYFTLSLNLFWIPGSPPMVLGFQWEYGE